MLIEATMLFLNFLYYAKIVKKLSSWPNLWILQIRKICGNVILKMFKTQMTEFQIFSRSYHFSLKLMCAIETKSLLEDQKPWSIIQLSFQDELGSFYKYSISASTTCSLESVVFSHILLAEI